jgi:hypothetical protein
MTWNPPPNWPKPPTPDWTPEPGWQPDPTWGPAPAGWDFTAAPATTMPSPTATAPHAAPGAPSPPLRPTATAAYRKHWVQLIAVGLVALAVGAGLGNRTSAASDEKAAAAEQRATTSEASAASASSERDAAKSEAADATSKANADTQASNAKVKADLAAQKADLDAREKKVSTAEAVAQSNTFDGTDGKYLVGPDIQPGTYRGTASAGCYYARLSNLDGGVGSIIENTNTDGPIVVRILASDKAFEVARCGTFTRISS